MNDANFFNALLGAASHEKDGKEKCFGRFSNSRERVMYLRSFEEMLKELFVNENGSSYPLNERQVESMFKTFDRNGDGKIDGEEFQSMWLSFILPTLKPQCALIVIDVQNDFIDGSLAIRNCPAGQEGREVVEVINRLLDTVQFSCVVYTFDWHPDDHVSFADNVPLRSFHHDSPVTAESAKTFDTVLFEGPPKMEQKLWPRHCVQKSWGAKLHPELKVVPDAIFIYKGTNPDVDSYSAFWDNQKMSETDLSKRLNALGITDVFVCGLAFDYCVGYTAVHSLEHGYKTLLIEDACRGVDTEDIKGTKERIFDLGGAVVSSDEVRNLVLGKDRRPELGYFAAVRCGKETE